VQDKRINATRMMQELENTSPDGHALGGGGRPLGRCGFPCCCVWRSRSWVRQCYANKAAYHQEALNESVAGPEFDLAASYGEAYLLIVVTLIYSTGLPILTFFACGGFTYKYYADKWAILNFYRRPPMYGDQFAQKTQQLLPGAIVLHMAFGCWLLSTVDKERKLSILERATTAHTLPIFFLLVVTVGFFAMKTVLEKITAFTDTPIEDWWQNYKDSKIVPTEDDGIKSGFDREEDEKTPTFSEAVNKESGSKGSFNRGTLKSYAIQNHPLYEDAFEHLKSRCRDPEKEETRARLQKKLRSAGQKLSLLKRRARDSGVSEVALETADDAKDVKEAVIGLILSHEVPDENVVPIERNAGGCEEPHSADPELWNIDGVEVDLGAKYRIGGQMWYLQDRAKDSIKVGAPIAGTPFNDKATSAKRLFAAGAPRKPPAKSVSNRSNKEVPWTPPPKRARTPPAASCSYCGEKRQLGACRWCGSEVEPLVAPSTATQIVRRPTPIRTGSGDRLFDACGAEVDMSVGVYARTPDKMLTFAQIEAEEEQALAAMKLQARYRGIQVRARVRGAQDKFRGKAERKDGKDGHMTKRQLRAPASTLPLLSPPQMKPAPAPAPAPTRPRPAPMPATNPVPAMIESETWAPAPAPPPPPPTTPALGIGEMGAPAPATALAPALAPAPILLPVQLAPLLVAKTRVKVRRHGPPPARPSRATRPSFE
jgi:hypothetical protein